MARFVSIVVVYFEDSRLKNAQHTLEMELKTNLDIGEHTRVGEAHACVIDVRVPKNLCCTLQRRLRKAMPTAQIKTMGRFRESWRGRHRWNTAIAIGGGIAVAFIVDLVRSPLDRLRDFFG